MDGRVQVDDPSATNEAHKHDLSAANEAPEPYVIQGK